MLVLCQGCHGENVRPNDRLEIGIKVAPTTMDPHLSASTANEGNFRHVFDALFNPGPDLTPQPALATGYRLIDDHTWEIDLRPNVQFHDGSVFDANDVLFSYNRLMHRDLPGSDGLMREMLAPIQTIEPLGDLRIRIVTKEPTPDLIKRLTEFFIVSDRIDPAATSEDFNRGLATVGTGPYKFVEWRKGEYVALQRFDQYWGEKPDFREVFLKEQTNDAARVAALETGDVDVIDFVPPLDAARLRKMSGETLYAISSSRVVFLRLDTLNAVSPQITDPNGHPLSGNPLKDRRVRRALSLAIARDLIVDKIMNGFAYKASQGVPSGLGGYDPEIPFEPFDRTAARGLLADAGYPLGFTITLTCPNDRLIKDAAICQAVGQMWSHIGVKTRVETMPKSIYFDRFLQNAFSAYMLSWGNDLGDSVSLLTSIIATRDNARGRGSWNVSYSNPRLDALIDEAFATMDAQLREKRLQTAMAIAIEDLAIIPLEAQPVLVATRKGLTYTPMANETTLAFNVHRAPVEQGK